MVNWQVERLKVYTVKWQSVIVLKVLSLLLGAEFPLMIESFGLLNDIFPWYSVLLIENLGESCALQSYNCVHQQRRLERVCCCLCLVILIWILRDWCWFAVVLGGVRPLPEWLPSPPHLAAQTETPPKTHITFYLYVPYLDSLSMPTCHLQRQLCLLSRIPILLRCMLGKNIILDMDLLLY